MSDLEQCLVYGASGYTGELIAELAAAAGAKPILAGRSADKVRAIADKHGMKWRAFGLDDAAAIEAGLEGVRVVIHAAGPFSRTSKPMLDACLKRRVHYTDITGEIDVFEACAERDAEAKSASIVVMPGTGFDVVPSDCLAKHVADRLPGATHLALAIATIGGRPSHGTTQTMIENMHRPNFVRREGKLTAVPTGQLKRSFDFGKGEKPALGIPWGDVATAYRSTKIPNIEVYMAMPSLAVWGARALGLLSPVIGSEPVQKVIKSRIDPGGPSAEERASAFSVLVGEAKRGDEVATTRLRVPEGYTLTALASLEIARRILGGKVDAGYKTPSMALGADFILGFDGVERIDL